MNTQTAPVPAADAAPLPGATNALAPINKVSVASVASAAVFLGVYLANRYLHAGIDASMESPLVVLVTFVAGWLTPPDAGGRNR